jgi:glutamyl-tRNA synthetase
MSLTPSSTASEHSYTTSVRARFAPSPTGDLHLGSALVALVNDAFVRAHGGTLVLRIDDTDPARSNLALVPAMIDELTWLGITWHEGPILQSARTDIHEAALRKLIASQQVYPCFCSDAHLDAMRDADRAAGRPPRYDGTCRELSMDTVSTRITAGEPHAWRLRVPEQEVVFTDLVRGPIRMPAGSFGDFIVCRADGSFMYQFASVVDDMSLNITHVIRGEDHLANTARQVVIFTALGADMPAFAHLPLLRSTSGSKLAKRDPLGTIEQLRKQGYLPATIRRYLAELLGLGEVDLTAAALPDLALIASGTAPMVDPDRLASLGRDTFASGGVDHALCVLEAAHMVIDDRWNAVVAEIAPGCATSNELINSIRALCAAPQEQLVADALARVLPADDISEQERARLLEIMEDTVGSVGDASEDDAVAAVAAWKQGSGLPAGQAMRLMRAALTAQQHGPPLPLLLAALGGEEALARIRAAKTLPGTGVIDRCKQ